MSDYKVLPTGERTITVTVKERDVVTVKENAVRGPIGVQGVQGIQGIQGVQGVQGVQGAQYVTAYTFDGGSATSDYTLGPAFDCGSAV